MLDTVAVGGSKLNCSTLPIVLYRTIKPDSIRMYANGARKNRRFQTPFREKRALGTIRIAMEEEQKRELEKE